MTREPYTIAYYTIRAYLRTVDAVEILREREDHGSRRAGALLDAMPCLAAPDLAVRARCYRPAVPQLMPPHVGC